MYNNIYIEQNKGLHYNKASRYKNALRRLRTWLRTVKCTQTKWCAYSGGLVNMTRLTTPGSAPENGYPLVGKFQNVWGKKKSAVHICWNNASIYLKFSGYVEYIISDVFNRDFSWSGSMRAVFGQLIHFFAKNGPRKLTNFPLRG